MALEREKATYWSKLPELVRSGEGRFVIIHGDEIAGFEDTYEGALQVGYDRYGLDGFLVHRVARVEPVHFLSRGLG